MNGKTSRIFCWCAFLSFFDTKFSRGRLDDDDDRHDAKGRPALPRQLREDEAQKFLIAARDAMRRGGGGDSGSGGDGDSPWHLLEKAATTAQGGTAQAKALFLLAIMELNRATGGARAFAPGSSSSNTIPSALNRARGEAPSSPSRGAPAAAPCVCRATRARTWSHALIDGSRPPLSRRVCGSLPTEVTTVA